jgi:hypothetical protein
MKQIALLLLCGVAWTGERVTIIRDEFGVPHIFASTAPGTAHGSGPTYFLRRDELEKHATAVKELTY